MRGSTFVLCAATAQILSVSAALPMRKQSKLSRWFAEANFLVNRQ